MSHSGPVGERVGWRRCRAAREIIGVVVVAMIVVPVLMVSVVAAGQESPSPQDSSTSEERATSAGALAVQTEGSTDSSWRGGLDFTVTATRNVIADRREGAFSLRFQRSFYAPRFWRFVLGLRPSLQLGMAPSVTFYPQVNVEIGIRMILLSFLSVEYYYGPRAGMQIGRDGRAFVGGLGSSAAWLIHPLRDNRYRVRFGVEIYRLRHLGGEDGFLGRPDYRNFAGFLGYEQAF